jgi:hypothetical protein
MHKDEKDVLLSFFLFFNEKKEGVRANAKQLMQLLDGLYCLIKVISRTVDVIM